MPRPVGCIASKSRPQLLEPQLRRVSNFKVALLKRSALRLCQLLPLLLSMKRIMMMRHAPPRNLLMPGYVYF